MNQEELTVERFWRLVRRAGPTECWEWLGAKSAKGYGRFKVATGRLVTDMVRKGRNYRGGGLRGESHHSARFTRSSVDVIRRRLANGESARGIARDLSVSSRSIDNIRHGRTWALEDIRRCAAEASA